METKDYNWNDLRGLKETAGSRTGVTSISTDKSIPEKEEKELSTFATVLYLSNSDNDFSIRGDLYKANIRRNGECEISKGIRSQKFTGERWKCDDGKAKLEFLVKEHLTQ